MSAALPDPVLQPEFYADIPMKRLVAFVVDMIVTLGLVLMVLPFTAFTGLFFLPLLFAVIGFAYRVVTLANGSATLGMRLMAIEFRDSDGRRLDLNTAVLHTLGFTLSWSVLVAQVASVVLMLTGARRQGLTDLVLGTVALNRRAGG